MLVAPTTLYLPVNLETIHQFYSTAVVQAYLTEKELRAVLQIPLKVDEKLFQAYNLITYPVYNSISGKWAPNGKLKTKFWWSVEGNYIITGQNSVNNVKWVIWLFVHFVRCIVKSSQKKPPTGPVTKLVIFNHFLIYKGLVYNLYFVRTSMNKRLFFFCRPLGYLTYYVIILLIILFMMRNTIKTGNLIVIYSTTLYIWGNFF